MAIRTSNQPCTSATAANFRLWGKSVSDSLAAFGWVKTSDTGQANWATAVATGCYELWAMTDTLQATKPIIMKIEYGNNANAPRVKITVGTASDGAGTLTGVAVCVPHDLPTYEDTGGTRVCLFSGDTNRFHMSLFDTHTYNYPIIFSIERTKDGTGADDGVGVVIASNNPGGSGGNMTTMSTVTAPPPRQSPWITCLTRDTTAAYGVNVGVSPIVPFLGQMLNPALGMAVYCSGDFSAGITFPMTIYGITHTYIPLRTTFDVDGVSNHRVAMRYE